jgi:hypothetical protein
MAHGIVVAERQHCGYGLRQTATSNCCRVKFAALCHAYTHRKPRCKVGLAFPSTTNKLAPMLRYQPVPRPARLARAIFWQCRGSSPAEVHGLRSLPACRLLRLSAGILLLVASLASAGQESRLMSINLPVTRISAIHPAMNMTPDVLFLYSALLCALAWGIPALLDRLMRPSK